MGAVSELAELQEVLGYRFRDQGLLETAITHRSFANEQREPDCRDNERLEFLGDAVIDVVVSHLLMERGPELGEGALSMARAQVVSERGLSRAARQLDLGRWLRLGRGEDQSGGREKSSLLADAFEAVVGAAYLDGGFDAAWQLVATHLGPAVARVKDGRRTDFKTRLQERAQEKMHATPEYRLLGESGPAHDKTFDVAVLVEGVELARASGKSKKAAEQRAAEIAEQALAERD